MYSLLAFGYFVFSTLPCTEVSAQNTIAITSGNNQSTTRGQNFPNAVTFTVTNGGNPVNNETVSFGLDVGSKNHVKMSETASGTFGESLSLSTNSSGEVTIHVKANTDSLYDTGIVSAVIVVNLTGVSAEFTGTITDVLYFSSDGTFANKITSTTRSVAAGTAANTNIGAAVSATHWANADTDTSNDVTLAYSLEGTDASSFSIDSGTGQLSTNTTMGAAGTSYSVTVKVEEKDPADNSVVRSSDTIDVTINATNAPMFTEGTSTSRSVVENTPAGQNIGAPVAATDADNDTLTYTLGGADASSFGIVSTSGQLRTSAALDYETKNSYSVSVSVSDGTGGSDSITVTINVTDVDEPLSPPPPPPPPPQTDTPAEETTNQPSSENTPPPVTPPKRRIIHQCPVGWVISDGFGGKTRRALLYEVKLDMDIHNPISIYKPVSVAIYVHPDEGLENLDGWKLQVAIPYNHHREYLLTAENSVVVDAGFVEGGFAFIANPKPEEDPFPLTGQGFFPMVGMGFTGALVPGFDYRLYDEAGRKVDFGIACYKRGDIFQVLKNMEDPRVLRKVLLETLDWDAAIYIRSEWTVPVPVNVPGAPSLQGVNLVGKWADLKKQ